VSGREAFWEHVHAALDARRDPLDLPEVHRRLAEEPELLGELAALRAGLDLLAIHRRRRIRSFAAAASLVALAALAGAWHVRRTQVASASTASPVETAMLEPTPGSQAAPTSPSRPQRTGASDADGSRVIAFRAEVSVEGPNGRLTATSDASGTRVASAWSHSDRDAPFHFQGLVAVTSARPLPR